NVTIDTVLPTLAITSSTQTLRAGQAALITFTLSEPSTTFTSGSVAVTGGSLSPITGTGTVYTATFTPTAGSTTPGLVSVAAGTFTDVAGNANATGAQSPSIAIDTVLPTVAITTSAQSLRIGQTAILTFTLSEVATDFTIGDVTVTGGALSDFAGSGTAYTATFTPFATSTVPGNVSIATGAFSDAFGNPNVAGSLALPIDIDTVAPAVSIAASPTALRAGQSAAITFTLSEASTTFSAGDVVATGGTLSSFAGSGATYTAVFTPADGSTAPGTISVAAGTFTDAFGNPNLAGALSPALAIDTVLPTIAITSSVASLRGGQSATITFTLSESSSDFGIGDISVAGGLLSNFAGSGANYTATFTPAANSTSPGVVSVPAGVFTDAFGNPNLAGTLGQPIAIDTVAPAFLTIASSAASLASGQTATITFTLSEPSTTFGIDDLVATGGTLSGFTGSGTTYSVTFTPSPDSTTAGNVLVPPGGFTDLAGNSNPAAALALPIAIDTVAPVVTGFSTTSPNRSYAIGDSIAILATLSEAVQPGGTVNVALNSGAVVSLTATGGTTLAGTYVIQPGNAATDLDVVGISPTGSLRDLAGNPLTSTALPPASESLAGRHAIVVDGAVKVLPVAGFSTDPALVPAVRLPVGRVALTFTTPVTGVTVDSFRLFLNGRSVSLRGSRITGSGQNYTLILPARRTTPRGIYTLEVVGDAGIRAVANGAAMTQSSLFYWGRSQSVGISRNAMLSAFASLR
ncbi:MAG: Ig-like domain-containing protein, partial [Planctomycetia bacterium]